MVKIEKYTTKFKSDWDSFIDTSKNGTFMLKRDYMEYHSDRFTDFSLMFYVDTKLVAVMPASLHGEQVRSHGGLTYGGIISNNEMKTKLMLDLFDALIPFLREYNINSLLYKRVPSIYHLYPSDEDLYALFKNNAKLVRRDISTTIDFLSNPIKLPKGRKAQISRAKREGVVIEESVNFESFINLENEILLIYHDSKAVHSANELLLLKSKFCINIKLYVALLSCEIVAGCVVFISEQVVHCQYMAANEIARRIGALDLVIHNLISEYSTSKRYFDFGISTEQDGMFLNEGLIFQKEGFGGRGIAYDFYELNI